MANHPEHASVYLAKIECFKKINVKSSIDSSVTSLWTACLSFYQEHCCKVWFGGPTQVWTKTTFDQRYVALSSIKSRVAYCETTVAFGRFIGKESIYVVSVTYSMKNFKVCKISFDEGRKSGVTDLHLVPILQYLLDMSDDNNCRQ